MLGSEMLAHANELHRMAAYLARDARATHVGLPRTGRLHAAVTWGGGYRPTSAPSSPGRGMTVGKV